MSFTPYTVNPDLDLELIRDVPVSAEAVFAAWTNPESLKPSTRTPKAGHSTTPWASTKAGAPSSTRWSSTSRPHE